MTDGFIRHLIAFIGLLIAILIFWSAYIAGANGWWWAAFGILIIYPIVYGLVNV